MPTLPWQNMQPIEDKSYVVMLTFLPLRRYRDTLRFFVYIRQVNKQLRQTKGLIGYSFRAKPLSRRYWTISAWESEQELGQFVSTMPHAGVRKNMSGAMGPTKFVSWTVSGKSLPLDWVEALSHQE